MSLRSWIAAACLAVAAVLIAPAFAWHGPGHDRVVREAVPALPGELPAFFRAGADAIADASIDPDCFIKPVATQPLAEGEGPEHYMDIENVPDIDHLPPTRYEFLELIYARKLRPAQVGLAPYAIAEWTQRLTVTFAQHRRWPDNQALRQRCLAYAGILSHYAADICQPLHTTIHYDGRVIRGRLMRTGIHLKLDAALGKLASPGVAAARDVRPAPFDDVLAAAVAELKRSHALVDRVYELERELPAFAAPLDQNARLAEFLRDRLAVAARFTASLFLTAWRNSERVRLPALFERPPVTADRLTTRPGGQPAGP
jgi:hypothetical protein